MWTPILPDGRTTRAVWQPAPKDIHNIRSWPPGTFMVIDQRDEWKRRGSPPNIKPFVGLGMVVANNGVDRIRVLWGANCRDAFLEYEVARLNPDVIRFLDSYSE